MYTVNPLNSMIKKAQDDESQFPFMESSSEPFFLTLAAASAIAKNGKDLTELIGQHKGDKLYVWLLQLYFSTNVYMH